MIPEEIAHLLLKFMLAGSMVCNIPVRKVVKKDADICLIARIIVRVELSGL